MPFSFCYPGRAMWRNGLIGWATTLQMAAGFDLIESNIRLPV